MDPKHAANLILHHLDDCRYAKGTIRILGYLEIHHDFDGGRNQLRGILYALESAGLVERSKALQGKGFAWGRTDKLWDESDPFRDAAKPPKAKGVRAVKSPAGVTEAAVNNIAEDITRVYVAALRDEILEKIGSQQQPDYAELLASLNEQLDERDKALVNTVVGKLGKGVMRHEIAVSVNGGPEVKVEGKAHPQLSRVLKLCAARLNVLLVGPAGSGKSHLARQAAECLDLPFAHISCTAGMSEGQLLGRLVPTGAAGAFEYLRSEFVRSYEDGGVFLLDEIDAADSNTLVVLNSCLANGHLAVPNRPHAPVATRHKNFVCVAAANTYGTGADRQYVGRNQLDEATIDRFRVGQVSVDYDPDLETALCPDDWLRERLQWYRRNCQAAKIRRVISTRFLREAYLSKQAGLTDAEIDEALFSGWSADEVSKATAGVKKPEPPKSDAHLNYSQHHKPSEGAFVKDILGHAPPPNPPGVQVPICGRGHGPMVRMHSGKGWRCNAAGNRYAGDGKWTVCNNCIFDSGKKGGQ